MCRELVRLVLDTINERYALKREDRHWVLNETREGNWKTKIRAENRHSFAFSLDHADQANRPLAFFGGEPPKGVARMCDAIMVCHHDQRCYLFLIELKTKYKKGYEKQLRNGKIFCDWLLKLYQEHGHACSAPVFVSLLIWFPRNSPPKQGTRHGTESLGISKNSINDPKGVFDHCFKIENLETIPVIQLCKQCSQ